MTRGNLQKFELNHQEEVSLFHIFDWNEREDTSEYIKSVIRSWKKAAGNGVRGLVILYIEAEPDNALLEGLLESGVNAFVVSSIESTNNVLNAFVHLSYNVFCTKPDVFTARKNRGKQVKLIYTPLCKKDLLNNFE
jgi:hypothetical protein